MEDKHPFGKISPENEWLFISLKEIQMMFEFQKDWYNYDLSHLTLYQANSQEWHFKLMTNDHALRGAFQLAERKGSQIGIKGVFYNHDQNEIFLDPTPCEIREYKEELWTQLSAPGDPSWYRILFILVPPAPFDFF